MTMGIAVFTFAPPIADLTTDTHVFHAAWMPHARMHIVWLLGVASSVGLIALYLLWIRQADQRFNVNFSAVLASCVLLAFFLSAFTMPLYGGALSDIDGGATNGPFGINGNVFAFSSASLLLVVGWILCLRSR